MKDKILLLLGIALVVWSFYMVLGQPAPESYQNYSLLKIGDNTIQVELADTNEKRSHGLSGRDPLSQDTGLLFIFENIGIYGFWMKDMKFSIDIVWIDEMWQVIGVERDVSPNTYPKTFYPNRAVKYVLEINSGEASRLGIDIGQQVFFDR